MSSYLLRILCLIAFSALYGCSNGSSEGGISGTGGPPRIIVNGQAEKGPFLKRSEVTYHYINEGGETLSEDFSTATTDDMGSFSLGLDEPGLIEIRVSGYHYDEINNQISDGLLTLSGLYIAGDEETQAARVNLLTHIIHDRVLMLMANENLSAGLAVTQAEQELLGELESIIPKAGINDFSQLSVYNRENTNENGNAYLLLFSAALYQHAINNTPQGSSLSGQLTGVLNVLTDDFEDGTLDTSGQLIDGLALAIQQIDSAEIVSNLEGRSNDILGETLEVPDFSGFIGQFLITFPAEDALLSETTPVRLEVPSGLKNVTLDLMVDGLVVDSITEAPYEFTWDPYYWSTDSTSRHTLLVKASNAVGAEVVSNLVSVSVLASSNNQLSLTSPVESQIITNSDSVSLQWALYQGASQYKVQVANTSSFTNILYETTTSNNQFDLTSLEVGGYYWRVRPENSEGRTGAWTLANSFNIAAPQAPSLLLPSDGASVRNTITPTLSWNTAESDASYLIQLSQQSDFSSIEQQQVVSSSDYTTASLSAGTYYWRLKATDSFGFESDFSSVSSFEVTGPIAPGGFVTSHEFTGSNYLVSLSWDEAELAISYEYQIAKDDSFSSIIFSNVLEGRSDSTSLVVGKYYFRIRSIDAGGLSGRWSASQELVIGLFSIRFGSQYVDIGGGEVKFDSLGNIYVTGNVRNQVNGTDLYIAKFSMTGERIWEKVVTGHLIKDASIFVNDGGVWLVGRKAESVYGDLYTLRLDFDGNTLFELIYDDSTYDAGVSVIKNNDDTWGIIGNTGASLSNSLPVIWRISNEGSVLSKIDIEQPDTGPIEAVSAFRIANDNLLISGTYWGDDRPGYAVHQGFLAEVQLDGALVWFTPSNYMRGDELSVLSNSSGYVVAGEEFNSYVAVVEMVSSAGDLIRSDTYWDFDSGAMNIGTLFTSFDDKIGLLGSNNTMPAMLELSPLGSEVNRFEFDRITADNMFFNSAALALDGSVVIFGSVWDGADEGDLWLFKLAPDYDYIPSIIDIKE